jgi:hypothetical protein
MVDALYARGRLPQLAVVWDFLRKSGSRRRAAGAHADNGSVGVAVYQLPGTNALDLQSQIKSKIEELSKRFPKGPQCSMAYDTTRFVSASVHDVMITLPGGGSAVASRSCPPHPESGQVGRRLATSALCQSRHLKQTANAPA